MSTTQTHHGSESQATDMATLKAAKKSLRTLMKPKLSSIPVELLNAQSANLHAVLLEFPPYQSARRISVYLSMPTAEIQTDSIVRSALGDGKQVFIPYLHANPAYRKSATGEVTSGPKRVMDMVSLRSLEDYEGLERDSWGIPSVGEQGLEGRERVLGVEGSASGLDLMLMPGVAFEKTDRGEIRRLGHGRGFYDFFLERYRNAYESGGQESNLKVYGLALHEQVVVEGVNEEKGVPVGELDSLLDGLLVGDGSIVEAAEEG